MMGPSARSSLRVSHIPQKEDSGGVGCLWGLAALVLPIVPGAVFALPHPDKPCSYQDDQAQSYASGRPGLYNACVVCRVVLACPGLTTRPSLCASLCVARGLRWCEHYYPRWVEHTTDRHVTSAHTHVLYSPASLIE